MKILLNAEYKALRFGEFVKADSSANECIFDTEHAKNSDQFAKTVYEEIAKAHGFEISSKKDKKEFYSELIAKLTELELPEMNEQPASELVNEVLTNGFAANLSDDDIMAKLYETGKVKIKDVQKVFKVACEKGGFRLSAKSIKEKVATALTAIEFTPAEYSEVETMCACFLKGTEDGSIEAIQGASEKVILSSIRAWAKSKDIALPKRTSGSANSGTSGLATRVLETLLDGNFLFENSENLPAIEVRVKQSLLVLKPNISDGQIPKYISSIMVSVNFALAVIKTTKAA